ncbi:MAG: hypothetical protein LUB83_03480 [Prevotellaceae bacterium]|nr:hypothetical protein [Prevotellaceae bacterium]
MVTLEDMLVAYYDCRRGKRNTASAIEFEMDYERRLLDLRDEINRRAYQPGRSICFVVRRPRYREVFAACFRDRIIHHYIALRLEPLFEEVFSPRTFNCRKGKGQSYGENMLMNDIIMCSDGYTVDCYIAKLDIEGFFMSIERRMMARMIDRFILEYYHGADIDDLRYLCKVVTIHAPEKNCVRRSPLEYWSHLSRNKSLFTVTEGYGMAIGNLFVQLFANFLLNLLDWFLESIGIIYHGRYVDDFYIIHRNKALLLSLIPKIREFLKEYGLTLHRKKFYIQHMTKGIEFTGTIVKPGRTYCTHRQAVAFTHAVERLNRATTAEQARNAVQSVNSYLGLLRHRNEYGLRRRVLGSLSENAFKYVYIRGHYEVVVLRREFCPHSIMINKAINYGKNKCGNCTAHGRVECECDSLACG